MLVDLGTRNRTTLQDIGQNSSLIHCLLWMHKEPSEFQIQSAKDLKLTEQEESKVEKERSVQIHHKMKTISKPKRQRNEVSQYVIEPNLHRWLFASWHISSGSVSTCYCEQGRRASLQPHQSSAQLKRSSRLGNSFSRKVLKKCCIFC